VRASSAAFDTMQKKQVPRRSRKELDNFQLGNQTSERKAKKKASRCIRDKCLSI